MRSSLLALSLLACPLLAALGASGMPVSGGVPWWGYRCYLGTGIVDGRIYVQARKAGLTLCTWQHGCGMSQAEFGQTFPTPVTDGERLCIATDFGGFFAFDAEGNRLWVAAVPRRSTSGEPPSSSRAGSDCAFRSSRILVVGNTVLNPKVWPCRP